MEATFTTRDIRDPAPRIPRAAPIWPMWMCFLLSWVAITPAMIPLLWTLPGLALAMVGLILALVCLHRHEYFHGVLGAVVFFVGTGLAYLIHFAILAYFAQQSHL